MKIGVNTWVWTSPFSTADFGLIPKVKEMGFDVLEVALEDPSIIDAKLLRKLTDDNGLSVTVCGAIPDAPMARSTSIDERRSTQTTGAVTTDSQVSGPATAAATRSGRRSPDADAGV